MARLHVGLLVERRYLTQAQPAGLCSALRARGHLVTVVDSHAATFEMTNEAWLDDLDLIVARGRSSPLLALLAWAEGRGIPTVNRRSAIAAVRNKAAMAVSLANAGVPTPRTFLGLPSHLATRVPESIYPVILKPVLGDNCRGLRVVFTADELKELPPPPRVLLAQEFLPSDGCDLKLYGIGDEVWPVRKPSPLHRTTPPPFPGPSSRSRAEAELLPMSPTLSALGRRCRDTFGLELYGVDCIETPGGPVVIEVNDFPNYTGVPDVDQRLTDYLRGRVHGGVPAMMGAAS